jgi:sugar phosphate isomerase/epimerase
MLIMHAYTYRAYDFDRACKKSKEHGWDGIELVGSHFDTKNLAGEKQRLGDTMAKYGVIAPVASWGADVMADDPDVRKANLDFIIAGLPHLKDLGVTKANCSCGGLMDPDRKESGSAIAEEHHYERAAEAYREVAKALAEQGMTASFEIHMHCLHDTARSTYKLLKMIGSPLVTANLDAGNMYGTPHAEEAVEAVNILGEKIGYVHAKNCRRLNDGTTDYSYDLETGHLDYFSIFQALKQVGFAGDVCCEYCGLGDPSVAGERDLHYLRRTLAELQMPGGKAC